MRIIPAKFQPSGTKGAGGDKGDRRTDAGRHAHFPTNAMRISTSSLGSHHAMQNNLFLFKVWTNTTKNYHTPYIGNVNMKREK